MVVVEPDRGGFTRVQASNGTQGFIKSSYLSPGNVTEAPVPPPPVPSAGLPGGTAQAMVQRPDNVRSTVLRKIATNARENSAWVDDRTEVLADATEDRLPPFL